MWIVRVWGKTLSSSLHGWSTAQGRGEEEGEEDNEECEGRRGEEEEIKGLKGEGEK